MREKMKVYRLLVGKPEGKRPLRRSRSRWEDNIKMQFVDIEWGGVDWIGLAQDRDNWRARVNVVINLPVPPNAEELWNGFTVGGLSSDAQRHRIS
jgi:hypothetical protein